jgi:hypothetical protein
MFDVAGVDQPRLKAVGLEQVEHRLPVVAGRLHHHPLDAQVDQAVGQLGHRSRHRRMGADLLDAPRACLARQPYTTHQLGLAEIERGHPLDDLLVIDRLAEHDRSSPTLHTQGDRTIQTPGVRPTGRAIGTRKANLVLVLTHQRRQH